LAGLGKAGLEVSESGVNRENSMLPQKGCRVKFLNYQTSCLYGMIEKLVSANGNYLVSCNDGIFESRAENLIISG
jgi:hypothetical protein